MDTLQQLILDMLQAKMPAKNPESLRHFIGEIKARDDHVLQAGAVLVNRDVGPDAKLSSTLVLELIAHADPFNVISAVLMLKIHCRNVTDQCLECFAYTTLKVLRNLLNDFSLVRALLLEVEILTNAITNYYCSINKPAFAAGILKDLAENASPTFGCLTTIHVDFLQVCIKAKLYGVAVRFINNQEMVEVEPEKTNVTIEDVLRYFYYSGICYCAEKKFLAALNAFITVLTIPAQAVSKIAEEALKKCKLVSLIENAKEFEVPKSVSHAMSRFASENMKPYDDIAFHFINSSYESLHEHVINCQDALDRDLNLGLAKQVLPAWRRNKLQLLSQTFVTLPLLEVAKHLGITELPECERFILSTVQLNGLKASMDVTQGLVYFADEDEEAMDPTTTLLFAAQLDASVKEIVRLTDYVKSAQIESLTSQKYIVKATTNSSGGRGGPSLSSSMMGSGMMEFAGAF